MKEIYHIPLVPDGGEENCYKLTQSFYEADAETLMDYVQSVLDELNELEGIWRPIKAGEIKVNGKVGSPYIVLRGEYPNEAPVMVAFFAKEKE